MKKGFRLKVVICLILAAVIVFTADAYAEKLKIRVVVDSARIRLKPDLQGEIIKNPPLGSVFEVEKQEGDWYEIRVRTEVGVLITGYIH